MPDASRLDVVLCWHMHQPEYRDLMSGQYQLPWSYLHAIHDYVDMAGHVAACPGARAVVNFAPLLLEHIEDYAQQVQRFLSEGEPIRDPLLQALGQAVLPADSQERSALIRGCLRANEQRVIDRFPPYRHLADLARSVLDKPGSWKYLNNQYLADLVTWFHLGWLGETVRRSDPRVQRLEDKGSGFTLHDRRELLQVINELLQSVTTRYSDLVEQGRVELSFSPHAHPMLPLLIHFNATREALPGARLPVMERYPGGEARAATQVREGQAIFQRHFGFVADGCWPSEGGISDLALKLLAGEDVKWAASGEQVLHNTLVRAGDKPEPDNKQWLHRMYVVPETGLRVFFRDDELSDLIGFTYADWHADDAVGDLVSRLEAIAGAYEDCSDKIVSIIMDGENAWEHYPENAWYFLSELYKQLSQHPRLNLTTFSDHMDRHGEGKQLPPVVAGSWVYGTFSTWMDDNEKNHAWDVLGDAKRAYDEVVSQDDIDAARRAKIDLQLAVCEGSDWFWWLGDYNPEDTVSDFERLFRLHLANLYALLHREPPDYLSQTLSHGHGRPARGGTMRRGKEEASG